MSELDQIRVLEEATSLDQIRVLIKKAEQEQNALYALQFSQAALNAANALRVLVEIKQIDPRNVPLR